MKYAIASLVLVLFYSFPCHAATVLVDNRPGSEGNVLAAQNPDSPPGVMENNAKGFGLKEGEYTVLYGEEGDAKRREADAAALAKVGIKE